MRFNLKTDMPAPRFSGGMRMWGQGKFRSAMTMGGAALAVLAGLSPAWAQDAPKTYWVCSILVPTSLQPPVVHYVISTVFRDQTTDAEAEAVERRYAAASMEAARNAGHSMASGVPGREANAFCMPMADEALAQKYRRDLFLAEKPALAIRRIPMDWVPQGAVAIASDPVPPLPPATKPGRLGVTMEAVGKNVAQNLGVPFELGFSDTADGAILTEVAEGSPAQRSGLQMMDVVIEVAGRKVTGPDDFRAMIAAQRPGTLVSMRIVRFGTFRTMDVLVGE